MIVLSRLINPLSSPQIVPCGRPCHSLESNPAALETTARVQAPDDGSRPGIAFMLILYLDGFVVE